MESNISFSTISFCHGVLEVRFKQFEDSIRYFEEHTGKVPSWMIRRRNDYLDAIDELKKAIQL